MVLRQIVIRCKFELESILVCLPKMFALRSLNLIKMAKCLVSLVVVVLKQSSSFFVI